MRLYYDAVIHGYLDDSLGCIVSGAGMSLRKFKDVLRRSEKTDLDKFFYPELTAPEIDAAKAEFETYLRRGSRGGIVACPQPGMYQE